MSTNYVHFKQNLKLKKEDEAQIRLGRTLSLGFLYYYFALKYPQGS